MALHIRRQVLPSDRQAVRAMVTATNFFRPHEIDVAEELVSEHLSKGSKSGYEFVFLEEDKHLLGYACYGAIAVTLGSFDLYWIVVHPAHQRHGHGQRLLLEAEQRIRAEQGRQVYIETSSQPLYAATQAFYARAGYRLEATLKDFYDVGDDKLIYVKSLSAPA
ncbi:MAG TPA: GNAT family N-acetyltransferase [Pirellulaceae bacterium]|nr:GNAT family N-acetyltransferase [Pirellulaceae bacterium]